MSDAVKPQIMTGLPPGTKTSGGRRVDFRVNDFDHLVAVKGLRYFWSRSALCPCQGNAQTTQVDPTCTLCNGKKWLPFLPDPTLTDQGTDAYGNPIVLNDAETAVEIRALITGITKDPADFERFGRWIYGTAKATVQSQNRIGQRDRLKARDATLSWSQLIKCDGGSEIIVTGMRSAVGLHTPIAILNLLRSTTTIYKEGTDLTITDDGTILWTGTPPTAGTWLTLQAEFYPTWVIMDHPYAARDTYVKQKSPTDAFKHLPLNATVKLDFLADGDG
jgi:hypothetical protein